MKCVHERRHSQAGLYGPGRGVTVEWPHCRVRSRGVSEVTPVGRVEGHALRSRPDPALGVTGVYIAS